MPRRKRRIVHVEAVRLFAERLRELRRSRGMTQQELARQAVVSVPYISRLESAGAAPGLDLMDRLARALGVATTDLIPVAALPDTMGVLQAQAEKLFRSIVPTADKETLILVNMFLARIAESVGRSR
jgi:transcriptional regulator with XRE-family HTH domain